eukprot:4227941-Prymnesium_polylepis.1
MADGISSRDSAAARRYTRTSASVRREGPDYPRKEMVMMYYSKVDENIEALGKATQRLTQRPKELIDELRAELQR